MDSKYLISNNIHSSNAPGSPQIYWRPTCCTVRTNTHLPLCCKLTAVTATTSRMFTFRMQKQKITFKMVEPGLLSSVMLNTIQMFLPVVHVVLKGPVAVVAVISLPHGANYIFRPGMRQTLYLWGTEKKKWLPWVPWQHDDRITVLQQLSLLYRIIPQQRHSLYGEPFTFFFI